MDGLVLDFPVNAVLAEAGEDVHAHRPAVAAEHTGEAVPEGDHRAVEHAVGPLDGMAADDGVAAVTPDGHDAVRRLGLPGQVFQFVSNDFAHSFSLYAKNFRGVHTFFRQEKSIKKELSAGRLRPAASHYRQTCVKHKRNMVPRQSFLLIPFPSRRKSTYASGCGAAAVSRRPRFLADDANLQGITCWPDTRPAESARRSRSHRSRNRAWRSSSRPHWPPHRRCRCG